MTILNDIAGAHGFKLALVDLDDTLYRQPKIPAIVRDKIEGFMVEKLGIDASEVKDLCYQLYLSHGTTVCGLVDRGYDIDMKEWHDYIHGCLDAHLDELLTADPALRKMLKSINIPKYIFTNADQEHTDRFLEQLGIADCFDGIICFETIQAQAASEGKAVGGRPLVVKPNVMAFEMALHQAGVKDPESVIFMDDSTRNISAAKEMGIHSILIGRDEPYENADMTLPSIMNLPSAMPELFYHPPRTENGKEAEVKPVEHAVEYAAFQ